MVEEIKPIAIEDKMKDSYLNYSLSVIVGRALPDVRDGLKPVHRRILYASSELGLTSDKPHKKSARIVGEVLGKYHPHGDRAVYDAMVRMAQYFNQRYLLIDGHGNFGSIDGDSPAAMRYTEARLTKLSENILSDFKMETVNFIDNFDGSLKEPVVLPTKIPNLLVNGSSGIAVGMSTNIPPHNITEIIEGLIYLLKHPNAKIKTLMKYIPGPDFPTGAKIIGTKGIENAYKKGKGKIKLRATSEIEKINRKKQIVITELPFQVNKSKLLEDIASLINKGKIENITDLRDETDKDGLRIVIELKQGTDSNLVLNRLYKYTSLQSTFRINLLALVDNKPQVMNIRKMMQHFIDFRRQIVKRRTQFNLDKAKNRYHILKGLKIAIDELDLVIAIIRNSKSTKEASKKLQSELKISKIQAEAILKMQLQRLVGMETNKLTKEAAKLADDIENYEKILANKEKLDNVIRNEFRQIKKEFSDERKTEIITDEQKAEIKKKDLIKEKNAIITYSYRQKLKRNSSRDNIRAGKNDYIIDITSGITYNNLLFFTKSGMVYSLPVHQITEHHGLSTGDSINKFIKIPLKEEIVRIMCLNEKINNNYVTIATEMGFVKKTIGKDYQTNYTSIKAINLNKNDNVIDVMGTDGKQEIMLSTKMGRIIRFDEDSISDTGRNTIGSYGIKLAKDDRAINMNIVNDNKYVVSITASGKANKINIGTFRNQKRNGKGVKTISSSNYEISAILTAKNEDCLLLIDDEENIFTLKIEDIVETQQPGYVYTVIKKLENRISSVFKLPVNPEE